MDLVLDGRIEDAARPIVGRRDERVDVDCQNEVVVVLGAAEGINVRDIRRWIRGRQRSIPVVCTLGDGGEPAGGNQRNSCDGKKNLSHSKLLSLLPWLPDVRSGPDCQPGGWL